ncbi:ribose-phosphate pyrophosphokinase-like domain-containing protein [Candidatus Laterigemmans baculatus]|nr:ribose-phosphate pyrophosphokinase-like domain-containing protein [Candidatus Laterigemmans baculatus]
MNSDEIRPLVNCRGRDVYVVQSLSGDSQTLYPDV